MSKFSEDPDFMAIQGASEHSEVSVDDKILSDI
jgi:hypothetical protein